MQKLIIGAMLFLATSFSAGLNAYTITAHNMTDDSVIVKGDLIGLDENVEIAKKSTAEISTGAKCINAIEVVSRDTSVRREIEGWCLIPGFTNKSKSWEVFIKYADPNPYGGGKGLTVQLR